MENKLKIINDAQYQNGISTIKKKDKGKSAKGCGTSQ